MKTGGRGDYIYRFGQKHLYVSMVAAGLFPLRLKKIMIRNPDRSVGKTAHINVFKKDWLVNF